MRGLVRVLKPDGQVLVSVMLIEATLIQPTATTFAAPLHVTVHVIRSIVSATDPLETRGSSSVARNQHFVTTIACSYSSIQLPPEFNFILLTDTKILCNRLAIQHERSA